MDLSNFDYRGFEEETPDTLFARYSPAALQTVAEQLLAGRSVFGLENEGIARLCAESLDNATQVDRHLRGLEANTKTMLSVLARTRAGVWNLSDLLTLQQIFCQTTSTDVFAELVKMGFAVPASTQPNLELDAWLQTGLLFFPQVLQRAILTRPIEFPAETTTASRSGQTGDGLEWLLRLAYAWQKLQAAPARVTNSGSLFKKDYQRLQADTVLASPIAQPHTEAPDLGIFTLQLGLRVHLFEIKNDILSAQAWPTSLIQSSETVMRAFWTATRAMFGWVPITGDQVATNTPIFAQASVPLMLLLDTLPPKETVSLKQLTQWIASRHPHWNVDLKESEKWVEQALGVWGVTLGMVEHTPSSNRSEIHYRLTPQGRACINLAHVADPVQTLPQCLVLQPNGEMIVYRQGLTPQLIQQLTLFADWKNIGSVCTLALSSESVYRGLEAGLTSNEIIRILQGHSTQSIPTNLTTSIQQWAGRRERIMVFASTNILEFNNLEDRDEAFQRGLITVKIGDRLGIAPEKELNFSHFRLLGNRDYESKPQQCIIFDEDGVTFTVDHNTSDLLLEGELNRFADFIPTNDGKRRYRLNPQKLRQASEQGLSRVELEQWFADRTGLPPTHAARLLATSHQGLQTSIQKVVVMSFPMEIADGLAQWPESKRFVIERYGKTHLSIHADKLDEFQQLLQGFGITIAEG